MLDPLDISTTDSFQNLFGILDNSSCNDNHEDNCGDRQAQRDCPLKLIAIICKDSDLEQTWMTCSKLSCQSFH